MTTYLRRLDIDTSFIPYSRVCLHVLHAIYIYLYYLSLHVCMQWSSVSLHVLKTIIISKKNFWDFENLV